MKQATVVIRNMNGIDDPESLDAQWKGGPDDYVVITDSFCEAIWDHVPEVHETVQIGTFLLRVVHVGFYIYVMQNGPKAKALAGKLSFPQHEPKGARS